MKQMEVNLTIFVSVPVDWTPQQVAEMLAPLLSGEYEAENKETGEKVFWKVSEVV